MANIGDIITLGSYPQNNLDYSKREPIEWLVLDKKDNSLLCISKYLLDCKPYHEILEKTVWAKCTLHDWLNNAFFNDAFTRAEQQQICVTDVINDEQHPEYNTKDRIFLLSQEEVEAYFEFEERATKTTAYARTQGAWFLDEKEAESEYELNTGSWWLRYPDSIEDEDAGFYDGVDCVNFDGYIEEDADYITARNCSVRPAFWVKL